MAVYECFVWFIAMAAQVQPSAIMRLNRLSSAASIHTRKVLQIPVPTASRSGLPLPPGVCACTQSQPRISHARRVRQSADRLQQSNGGNHVCFPGLDAMCRGDMACSTDLDTKPSQNGSQQAVGKSPVSVGYSRWVEWPLSSLTAFLFQAEERQASHDKQATDRLVPAVDDGLSEHPTTD